MTCRDFDSIFIESPLSADQERALREHLKQCERCRGLRDVLEGSATDAKVTPAVLASARNSILSSLTPVKPLPPTWILAGSLFMLLAIVAAGAAAILGMFGIRVLSAMQATAVFSTLGLFLLMATLSGACEMVPGTRRFVNPSLLVLAAGASIALVFAAVFQDYSLGTFVHSGIPCLVAGLALAIPAGGIVWFVLNRGFLLDRGRAGLAAGTMAGLAGLAMLELHCPNLRVPHLVIWHIAVVAVSGAAGYSYGCLMNRRDAEFMQ